MPLPVRILIVDDEELVAHTVALIFRQRGFDTVIAHDADAALSALRAAPFNLILCDIDMPVRDGISLMNDIGRELPQCPILVLTGFYSSLARVRDCADRLCQRVAILTKPCQPVELLRTATDMLQIA